MRTTAHGISLKVLWKRGFTLIELLVTVAVFAVLLAVLIPAMQMSRRLARRVACRSNLCQIALAWHSYLDDNNQRFCQGVNVNLDFGGWQGTGGYALRRPLNKYVGLDTAVAAPGEANLFRCPSDRGGIVGRPPQQLAYDYFGNSYQTNVFLIGPNRVPVPKNELEELIKALNAELLVITRDRVSEPRRLLLVGDSNWVTQWSKGSPEGEAWHGRENLYNLAFLDGHAELVRIAKGPFVTPTYRVLPFAKLDELIPPEYRYNACP